MPPVVHEQYRVYPSFSQGAPGLAEVAAVLEVIDASPLLARLEAYRWKGHRFRGRPRLLRFRFLARIPSPASFSTCRVRTPCCAVSKTIRHSGSSAGSLACHTAPTFNRFISRLGRHQPLWLVASRTWVDRLVDVLPGFGKKIAVDSSIVRTHAHPKGRRAPRLAPSDPEASWTAKQDNRGEKEWHFGYKYHLIADATYGIPITGFTTTAKSNDSPTLPQLLDQATALHECGRPRTSWLTAGTTQRRITKRSRPGAPSPSSQSGRRRMAGNSTKTFTTTTPLQRAWECAQWST